MNVTPFLYTYIEIITFQADLPWHLDRKMYCIKRKRICIGVHVPAHPHLKSDCIG